jgi:hypothetical protein
LATQLNAILQFANWVVPHTLAVTDVADPCLTVVHLIGSPPDRLTQQGQILEMNGDSYRLATSQKRARKRAALAQPMNHRALE